MKQIIPFFYFLVLAGISYAQDYKAQFDQYCQEGDTTKQIELLQKWETENSDNPELITSYFNYYFLKSRKEILAMKPQDQGKESLVLTDSTGREAGFIVSEFIYDPETLNKGFERIDKGIDLYPDRLDMRFGKIYALGQIEDWPEFTDEIVKTIRYSNQNDNQWKWTNDEKKEDGKEFFLSSIQGYQLDLYYTEDDDLLVNMRTIAEEILKYYPDHIESLSNLSITYLVTGQYDKALEALLKAERINPKDGIVLSNIARGYELKGDIDRSIAYYEKMLTLDNTEAKEFAKQRIEELKNK